MNGLLWKGGDVPWYIELRAWLLTRLAGSILTIVTELITVIKLVCLVRQERAQQRGRQQHGINV